MHGLPILLSRLCALRGGLGAFIARSFRFALCMQLVPKLQNSIVYMPAANASRLPHAFENAARHASIMELSLAFFSKWACSTSTQLRTARPKHISLTRAPHISINFNGYFTAQRREFPPTFGAQRKSITASNMRGVFGSGVQL